MMRLVTSTRRDDHEFEFLFPPSFDRIQFDCYSNWKLVFNLRRLFVFILLNSSSEGEV